ncbi:IS1595 family transposase [Haloglomus irregulare]|jgi:transposase-like protein|uniref:IS1595 family transposase n=1 Tax=Haloglomus irregulare TaxID=2234134 RepID=A0A554MVT7_9EURY|nr:IS1595 family transposase [Haloglomus irregulare]TSD09236.1 IS1595 family transposase [Haloglomus irregulare]
MHNQTAFGGMLRESVDLTSIVLRPEPLDAEIERRCKQAWKEAPCPECGEIAIQTGDGSPRVWCTNCRYVFTYTRNTPFEGRTLTSGEIAIAFVLYADTLLSIHQITQLFDAVYDTIHTTIREIEAAFERGFYLVWERIQHTIDGPTQIDETGQKCSGYKGQTPPRDGLSRGGSGEGGRSRWEGTPGDTMTIIGACRDTLRVLRAEPGAQPEELKPALDEVEILSGKLNDVWHDGWRGYAPFVYDNEQTVVHSEEFVTDDGVHINQVECLWSLVNPWPRKFRGLSKPGLEQSVRTYGFVRTLNLAEAPLHGLLDCFVVNVFR